MFNYGDNYYDWDFSNQNKRRGIRRVRENKNADISNLDSVVRFDGALWEDDGSFWTGMSQKNAQAGDVRCKIIEVAKQYINYKPKIPYAWAGRSVNGMDCSGYVHTVINESCGIKLPTSSQAIFNSHLVTAINKNELMPGDLMFFSHSGSKQAITHVAIYAGTVSRNGIMTRYFFNSASSPNGKGESGVIPSYEIEPYWKRTFVACGRIVK